MNIAQRESDSGSDAVGPALLHAGARTTIRSPPNVSMGGD
jgi:hypothetical protein